MRTVRNTSMLGRALWTALFLVASGGVAWAVTPASFTQTTEADFTRGQMKNLVVTSQGEMTLARPMEILMPNDTAPGAVAAVACNGKTVYVASAGDGTVYKIEGGKAEKFAVAPSTVTCSLLWTGKELLVGTGGKEAGIFTISDKGEVKPLWSDAKARYVWAMARDEKGNVFAATGPEAAVFAIDPAGKGQLIYQAPAKLAKNFLSLALGKDGQLYAGSDQNGLVFEINVTAKTGRIILDADEKEITALAVDARGGVYAATSDVSKVGDGAIQPSQEKTGRTETTSAPTSAPAPAPIPVPGPTTKPKKDGHKDSSSETQAPTPHAIRVVHVAPAPKAAEAPAAAPSPAPQPAGGNGVYYIRPDGLVNTVFRRPVTIQSMILHGDQLVLGTGSGKIYSVSNDGDEITLLLSTEARQVTCLADSSEGIAFGTSGKGSVGLLKTGLAKDGTFTSEALDAKQMARWGKLKFLASTPGGAKLTVSTRSGNVTEPDDATWSAWSNEQPMGDEYLAIPSPAGRFLQYRLKFTAGEKASATLRQIQAVYQVSNLAPAVSGIKVASSARGKEAFAGPSPTGDEGPKAFRLVGIQASDQNNDKLIFTIAAREVGTEAWIAIAEKLAEPRYAWDTRTVGDGTYELKVTASDSPSNPPETAMEGTRVSEPVIVDNTAPVVKPLVAKVDGTKASVTGSSADAGSQITSIQYSVDSASEWTTVLPVSGICDDKKEDFRFDVKDLKPGAHRISVKVEDSYGNVGYGTATVTVAK